MKNNKDCHSFQVLSNTSEEIRHVVEDRIKSSILHLIYDLFENEISQLCGERYARHRDKSYQRAGSDKGSVLASRPKTASLENLVSKNQDTM